MPQRPQVRHWRSDARLTANSSAARAPPAPAGVFLAVLLGVLRPAVVQGRFQEMMLESSIIRLLRPAGKGLGLWQLRQD